MSAKTARNPSEPTDGLQSKPPGPRAGVSDDRRVVLESIAYGADPKVSPGDRLKALELLREFERADPDLDDLSVEQIEAELDDFYAAMVSLMFTDPSLTPDAERYPRTAKKLREYVEMEVDRQVGTRSLRDEERQARDRPIEREPDDSEYNVEADAEAPTRHTLAPTGIDGRSV